MHCLDESKHKPIGVYLRILLSYLPIRPIIIDLIFECQM